MGGKASFKFYDTLAAFKLNSGFVYIGFENPFSPRTVGGRGVKIFKVR